MKSYVRRLKYSCDCSTLDSTQNVYLSKGIGGGSGNNGGATENLKLVEKTERRVGRCVEAQ